MNIPNWLNWFLADISFHSIHHLCERIPNYNLRACHKANIHLLQQSKFLTLREFSNIVPLHEWPNQLQNLFEDATLRIPSNSLRGGTTEIMKGIIARQLGLR